MISESMNQVINTLQNVKIVSVCNWMSVVCVLGGGRVYKVTFSQIQRSVRESPNKIYDTDIELD